MINRKCTKTRSKERSHGLFLGAEAVIKTLPQPMLISNKLVGYMLIVIHFFAKGARMQHLS